ncbi:hypothetical protein CAPTEDRAFT_216838 [Capitella teleta]|uniref:LRRCT domain-containing protein n=1 Tax=Capitella teleta TaxID=283909 RepID=R7UYY6_CAPTE|nr:hypothetical protein CAPTEDRAFT_216838 [Capitella teleta]|eukprot:ELU09152.1 hypothetical protein CAPTEDRAFT_216838 [Capitella teleta]
MEFLLVLCFLLGANSYTFVEYEMGLTEFPPVPSNSLKVNVSMNAITYLGPNIMFNCAHLSEFVAKNNLIHDVDPLAFNGTVISALYMTNNKLTTVPTLRVIADTLEFLGLIGNQIDDLTALRDLTKLVKVFLGRNMVSTVDPNVFDKLIHLENIYLTMNRITTLNWATSLTPPVTFNFNLKGNPVLEYCTCYLLHILQSLHSKVNIVGTCMNPSGNEISTGDFVAAAVCSATEYSQKDPE